MEPLGIALIGGGLFARGQHLPAIQNCPDLCLRAIYSRSHKSARLTSDLLPDSHSQVDLYADDLGSGKTYHDLLLREDVSAVIVALPISSQPEYIEAALAANKHVLAEKPLARDLVAAKKLLKFYDEQVKAQGKTATLSIAENIRFTPSYLYAAEQAAKLGRATHFNVNIMALMDASNKYFHTPWRAAPDHQGGFLLDGGVHHAAATRLLLGQQNKVASVQAATSQVQDNLPPIDSVSAILKTATGATGTWQNSQGTTMSDHTFDFAFERGTVKVVRDTVTVKLVGGNAVVKDFERSSGVSEEVAAWAAAMRDGKGGDRMASPQEALADLEFMEKMFQSGEQDGKRMTYELQ